MIVSSFNKRIEELERKIYDKEFDISKYFLPDEEIVKNIIKFKNPSMSKSDIDLMVHGPNYNPPIDSLSSVSNITENVTKNNYNFQISNNGDGWIAKIFYEGREIGKKQYIQNYTSNIENIQYSGAEAVQKELESEANNFGFNFDGKSYPKRVVVEVQKAYLDYNSKKIESDVIPSNLSGYSPYPLGKNSQYYQEALRYKEEVKKSVALFMLSKKELINQLASSLTLLSSSIPGIGIMVSAPPWNIPAALSLASLVLDSLNDLISKSVKVIENLSPLKNLFLLLSNEKLMSILRILNPVVSVLMAILDPIEKIKKFILKLIEKIKSLFNSNKCRKQIRRIKKQITKKESELEIKNNELVKKKKELDALKKQLSMMISRSSFTLNPPSVNSTIRVSINYLQNTISLSATSLSSLEDDVEEISDDLNDLKEQLAEIEKRCGKRVSIEQDMQELNSMVDQVNTESDKWIDSLNFETVYDVLLPDGSTLIGLTEEQLNSLKQEYTIIFNN